MRRSLIALVFILVLGLIPTRAAAQGLSASDLLDRLDGVGVLVSYDGQDYLGLVTSNCWHPDAITNEFGRYGSDFSTDSITNDFGRYGSEFSGVSAYNELASQPPVIWGPSGGHWRPILYVTANRLLQPGLHPDFVLGYLKAKGC